MKKEKGITLIALIITIIIMLILAGVVINLTIGENGLFKTAKTAAREYEIASIKEQIMTDIYSKQVENMGNISEDNLRKVLEKYGTLSEEEKLTDKTLTTTKGNYEIKVSDLFNGTTVKEEPKDPIGPVIADKSGANAPNVSKIAKKTYVTWDLNKEETEYVINDVQTIQPDNWYDYENGKWANIKTTNEEEGLEAYWVWIPRYEYIVPTSTTATQIEVKFIPTSKKVADGGYIIHPAFTNEGNGGFGDLDGIWVAKFEASSNSTAPDTTYGGGNDTNLKVQVKPSVQSWRNISPSNMFSVCRRMTNSGEVLAGSTVNSHMMKNTEWGAVAILSQSKYGIYNPQSSTGINGDKTYQIWNNPNGYSAGKFIKTGYVGSSKDASISYSSSTAPSAYAYDSIKGPKASTTGTVYGVYDMAGGSNEYIGGVMKGDSSDNSKDLEYANSLFDISNQPKQEEISNLDFANKYLNLYNYRSSNVKDNQYIIGDATEETKMWNKDYSSLVSTAYPLVTRGRSL